MNRSSGGPRARRWFALPLGLAFAAAAPAGVLPGSGAPGVQGSLDERRDPLGGRAHHHAPPGVDPVRHLGVHDHRDGAPKPVRGRPGRGPVGGPESGVGSGRPPRALATRGFPAVPVFGGRQLPPSDLCGPDHGRGAPPRLAGSPGDPGPLRGRADPQRPFGVRRGGGADRPAQETPGPRQHQSDPERDRPLPAREPHRAGRRRRTSSRASRT